MKKNISLIITFYFLLFTTIDARGISTNFVNVIIERLSLGKEYRHNQPLKVTSKSANKTEVVISVQIPQEDNLKSGFLPIPDVSWIKIVPDKYILEPYQTGISDVIIKIPKDKKLAGKSFQVNLEIIGYPEDIKSGTVIVPAILSKIRFSIRKGKND